jgi:ESCRT-II complex subunit VPS36
LAQSINERLSVQEAASSNPNTSSSETTLIRTSLLNLGLPTPAVTADMMKDEVKYHEELAKELGEVLSRKGGVMEKGMVGLDEAWCVWNRARGVGKFPSPLSSSSTSYLTRSL